MQTIAVTGGTGTVGASLCKMLLSRGYKVIVFSRQLRHSDHPQLSYAHWDIEKARIDADSLRQADIIVHLAGANVGSKRWTDHRKEVIRKSRTESTRLLYDSLKKIDHRPKAFICASAVGFYGSSPEQCFAESGSPASGFLGETCRMWEAEALRMKELCNRVVILRTGLVLSKGEGLLGGLKKPLMLGIAGIPGNGQQWISWIHLRDLCRLYFSAIQDENWQGIYNAVAPHPARSKDLILGFARILKGHFFVPFYIPAFLLRLFLGEMSEELLKSCKVSAQKVMANGFQFSFPSYQEALEEIFVTPLPK